MAKMLFESFGKIENVGDFNLKYHGRDFYNQTHTMFIIPSDATLEGC